MKNKTFIYIFIVWFFFQQILVPFALANEATSSGSTSQPEVLGILPTSTPTPFPTPTQPPPLIPTPSPSLTAAPTIIPLQPTPMLQDLPKNKPQKLSLAKQNFQANEKIEIDTGNSNPNDLKIAVYKKGGEEIPVKIVEEDGKLKINPSRDFRPGKYTIKIQNNTTKDILLEQDFTWGVLAINTNKSIYLPGETAYLQMAALRNDGDTICDANLRLQILNPKSEIRNLSTGEGTIQYSGECLGNNVTDVPDYFAYYKIGKSGIYEMKLTNLDNGYEITDSFEVKESVPFDVERIGATRINPNRANYEMKLKIKANEDFTGDIRESVPNSFDILNPDSQFIIQEQSNEEKVLIWQNISLKQGDELEIKYTYDAPNISPEFYLLGPLKIGDPSAGSGQVFQEARQWQIAADAVIYSNGTGGGTWATTTTWAGGVVPNSTSDEAVIVANDTVTLGAATSAFNVTINANAILAGSNRTLTVKSNYTNNGTHSGSSTTCIIMAGTTKVIDGTGLNTCTGILSLTTGAKSFAATANLTFSGGLTTVIATTITAGAQVTVNGTFTDTSPGAVTNNGTVTAKSTLTGTGSWTQGTNSTLNAAGATTNAVAISGTFTATASGNTVNYNLAGAQTCKVTTYYNLNFSTSGAKTCAVTGSTVTNVTTSSTGVALTWTMTAALTLAGTLTVEANTTVTTGGVAFTVTGATGVTGTLTNTNNTGAKTYIGLVTVYNGGLFNGASTNIITRAGITNDGTVSITGTDTISTAGAVFSGANSISIAIITVTSPGTVTNNGTVTMTGLLSGTGLWTQGANSTLNAGGSGANAVTISTFDASTYTNTVNYNGTDQTVKAVAYYSLTLSTSGAKTMTNVTTIGGDLTISGSATMTSNAAFTLTGTFNYDSSGATTLAASTNISIGTYDQTAGTLTDNGVIITVTGTGASTWSKSAGTFTPTGTVTFTGAAPQIGTSNFNNLTINVGNGNTATLTGAADINGNYINSTGTFDANDLNINVAKNWTISGGSFTAKSGGGATTQTVTFDSTNESIISGSTTFNNLTMDASVDGAKTITFTAGTTQTISSGKTWTINGASGKVLTLQSSSPSSAWYFNISAPMTSGNYLAVKDSWSANTNKITPGSNVTNNGNNDGWIFNQSPNNPFPDLAQKKTNDTTLDTSDWTNETSVKFTATADDPDSSDTLYLCVEKKAIGTAFTGPEDGCSSPGVSYMGDPVTVTVTIEGVTDTEYHWRARVKDAADAYSAWVAYGSNPAGDGSGDGSPANRDYGIDTSDPTGGTVYDGTETGVDKNFNGGSLSQLSGNWSSFNANVSGLARYDYAIGTSAGGTNVVDWTSNNTDTSVTAAGLTLQTSKLYYFSVRAVDNAGNIQSGVSSDGQVVSPSLTFTVSPATLSFSNLNSGNNYTASKDTTLTTSTNAYGGYLIRAYVTDYLTSTDTSKEIPDFDGGTYSNPGTWGEGNTGFGYTSLDTTIQGLNKFESGTLYAPFSQTGPGDIVADHTANVTGNPISNEQLITNKVKTSAIQTAANYVTTVIYTITAQY